MKQQTFEKAVLEIYLAFRNHSGSFSSVSGYLGSNDSGKISRQINPSDDRRDNPYEEVLEIQRALMSFSPELEAKVWGIIERERNSHRKDCPNKKEELATLMHKIIEELSDVVSINMKNGSNSELEKESFELVQAAKNFYERVKSEN
jgi:hypothetical protein